MKPSEKSKNTNELMQILSSAKTPEELQAYTETLKQEHISCSFADFISEKLRERELSAADLIRNSMIQRNYGYQLLNGTRTPSSTGQASAHIPHLSVLHRPVFLLNSCLSLFSAACSRRHPLSRSYGVILPSSLTRVLPFVSGFSPRPPASVSGTGTFGCTSSFSRQRELTRFPTEISVRITPQLVGLRTSLQPNLNACTGLTITLLELSFCVTASFHR